MTPASATVARGQALRGLGQALVRQDKQDEGKAHLTEALAILRGHFDGADPEILRCLDGLALDALEQADYTTAADLYRQVISARRELGSGPALGRSLAGLGLVRFRQGVLDDARELLEEALPMLREAMGGDNAYVAEVLASAHGVKTLAFSSRSPPRRKTPGDSSRPTPQNKASGDPSSPHSAEEGPWRPLLAFPGGGRLWANRFVGARHSASGRKNRR